eukprot:6201696-Pleurochrysis_carterae.AAC.3
MGTNERVAHAQWRATRTNKDERLVPTRMRCQASTSSGSCRIAGLRFPASGARSIYEEGTEHSKQAPRCARCLPTSRPSAARTGAFAW